MALPETLSTPRLRLRPFRDDDGPWLERGLGRFEIARMLIAVPHPLPKGRARHWLGRIAAEASGGGLYAVEACNEPVGCAALTGTGALELGYWFLPEAWGRGYATEAGAALRDGAFAAGTPALKARHAADNRASARVLAKLGFRRLGESPRWYQARRMEAPSISCRLDRPDWLAMTHTLETPRLRLRPLAPADAPAIRALAGDFEVARWTARIPFPFPEGAAEAFIAAASADLGSGDELALAIAAREDSNRLLGCCGLMRRADGSFELGYWLGRPFWGRGYATEAVSALADHAFRATGTAYLRAGIFPDNRASEHVLLKAGFSEAGTDWCPTPARDFDGLETRLFVLTREAWARRVKAVLDRT